MIASERHARPVCYVWYLGGGPCRRLRPLPPPPEPPDATEEVSSGHGGDPMPQVLRCSHLNTGLAATVFLPPLSYWWALGKGEMGASIISLPLVAVVTASAARDFVWGGSQGCIKG